MIIFDTLPAHLNITEYSVLEKVISNEIPNMPIITGIGNSFVAAITSNL